MVNHQLIVVAPPGGALVWIYHVGFLFLRVFFDTARRTQSHKGSTNKHIKETSAFNTQLQAPSEHKDGMTRKRDPRPIANENDQNLHIRSYYQQDGYNMLIYVLLLLPLVITLIDCRPRHGCIYHVSLV